MSEKIRARTFDTDEEVEIEESMPLASAVEFKRLSDIIWERHPGHAHSNHSYAVSMLSAQETKDAFNIAVQEIDERLILPDTYGESGTDTIDDLLAAYIGTANWDKYTTTRWVVADGHLKGFKLPDGQTDYSRELSMKFHFGRNAVVRYAMHREQAYQGQGTAMNVNIWHNNRVTRGYEGDEMLHLPLTEAQEFRILEMMGYLLGERS